MVVTLSASYIQLHDMKRNLPDPIRQRLSAALKRAHRDAEREGMDKEWPPL